MYIYSKTCIKQPLSKRKKWFSRPIIACQKYCRILQGVHSVMFLTLIYLPLRFVFFDLRFYVCFTVLPAILGKVGKMDELKPRQNCDCSAIIMQSSKLLNCWDV